MTCPNYFHSFLQVGQSDSSLYLHFIDGGKERAESEMVQRLCRQQLTDEPLRQVTWKRCKNLIYVTRLPRGALRHKDPPYRPVTARKGTVAKRALWCFHFLLKTFRSLCLPKDFPTQKKQSGWLWPLPKAPLQLRLGPPCECLRGVQSRCYEGSWGRQRLWTLRVSTHSQRGTGKARKIPVVNHNSFLNTANT